MKIMQMKNSIPGLAEGLVLILEQVANMSMGRYMLSKKTGLSTTKLKIILERMQERGIVKIEGRSPGRRGTSLSLEGKEVLDKVNQYISVVFSDEYVLSDELFSENDKHYCLVYLPQERMATLTNSTVLRDIAVKNGTRGAYILKWNVETNKYESLDDGFPFFENVSHKPASKNCKRGVLVVGFGENEGSVNYGTVAAAVSLHDMSLPDLIL